MGHFNHLRLALPGILLAGSLLIATCGGDGSAPSALSEPRSTQDSQVLTEPTSLKGDDPTKSATEQEPQQPPEIARTSELTAVPTSAIAVPIVSEVSSTFEPPAQPTYISSSIHNFRLEDLNILVRTTVTWVHNDPVDFCHTSTSGGPRELTDFWESGDLCRGDIYTVTFDEVGEFPYFCQIHPTTMRAVVTVVESENTDSSLGTVLTVPPNEDLYSDLYDY